MEYVDPEFEPNEQERQQLGQLMEMPGWAVVRKIGLSEVARFQVRLANLDPERQPNYDKLVLEFNRQAKVAQMIWQGLSQRFETERGMLLQEEGPGTTIEDPLPDVTAEILES